MSQITELDILSKYLDEDELKEIAKQAAYDLFKSSIGPDNPHRKANIEFYAIRGAMLAMKEAQDITFLDTLQSEFNAKVKRAVKSLQWYQIDTKQFGYTKIVENAIKTNESTIINKINELVNAKVNNDEDYDSLCSNVNDYVGECMGSLIYEMLEQKFKKD